MPFNFDVHALFFSDDAVSVETELHHRFAARRVNRTSTRGANSSTLPPQGSKPSRTSPETSSNSPKEPEAEQYRLEEARASAECGGSR